jgi:hypothetical protein
VFYLLTHESLLPSGFSSWLMSLVFEVFFKHQIICMIFGFFFFWVLFLGLRGGGMCFSCQFGKSSPFFSRLLLLVFTLIMVVLKCCWVRVRSSWRVS